MKLLITGADGQLGRCLQDVLSGTSHEVHALNRGGLDITNPEAVFNKISEFKPDVVINAAAYTAVDKAESDRETAWLINAKAVEHIAEAVNAVGATLVHVSTDYVFSGDASRPYRETDPVDPSGVYGASKLAGEQAASTASQYAVVRTAWVFSEYGNNFVKTMLRLAKERDSLSIVDDQVGTPTYAGDLARALVRIAEQPLENGIFHFSGGVPCSWFEFAREIFGGNAKLDSTFVLPTINPISSDQFPTPAKRPAYSVLDGGKLLECAGIGSGDWRQALQGVCKKLLDS